MRRPLVTALLVFAAWTALAVFFGISTSLTYISQGRPGLWPKTIATELAQWWLWAAFTPLVFWITNRLPFTRRRWPVALAAQLPVSVAVAFVTVLAENNVRVWLFHVRPYLLISNLALKFLIYWSLVAGAQALSQYGRSRARAAEAETALGQAQLVLLRAQLQPHFLFNALNTIAELIHEDPDRADRMIDRLSGLLRATLDAGDRAEVALGDELAALEHYLAIQHARFGDVLRTTIDVPAGVRHARVPHLILQPLVENAIRHGLAPRAGGGAVQIAAAQHGSVLVIDVIDDGVGWPAGEPVNGVGLANTTARLRALYGENASLTRNRPSPRGAAVRITLPFHTVPRDPRVPARPFAS